MRDKSNSRGVSLSMGAASAALVLAAMAGFAALTSPGQRAAAQGTAAAESPTEEGAVVRAAVEEVVRAQVDAWNKGDVDEFVKYYWNSDDVTFSSGGKVTRGWTATANNYRERYPTREAMGRVTFSNLETTPLGDEAALILGEWKLERADEPMAGNFTLVFRKLDDRWVIIHDHTSRLME